VLVGAVHDPEVEPRLVEVGLSGRQVEPLRTGEGDELGNGGNTTRASLML
jgi:hypothetical protein